MRGGESGLPAKSLQTHDEQISTPKPSFCDSSYLESLQKDQALLILWQMPATRVRPHNFSEHKGVNRCFFCSDSSQRQSLRDQESNLSEWRCVAVALLTKMQEEQFLGSVLFWFVDWRFFWGEGGCWMQNKKFSWRSKGLESKNFFTPVRIPVSYRKEIPGLFLSLLPETC